MARSRQTTRQDRANLAPLATERFTSECVAVIAIPRSKRVAEMSHSAIRHTTVRLQGTAVRLRPDPSRAAESP